MKFELCEKVASKMDSEPSLDVCWPGSIIGVMLFWVALSPAGYHSHGLLRGDPGLSFTSTDMELIYRTRRLCVLGFTSQILLSQKIFILIERKSKKKIMFKFISSNVPSDGVTLQGNLMIWEMTTVSYWILNNIWVSTFSQYFCIMNFMKLHSHFSGWVPDCDNSIVNTLELVQPCAKPST